MPVRGLHLSVPRAEDLPLLLRFIREGLPKEGVNTLVLEFNYRYRFTRRPEVIDSGALAREDVKQIVAACRQAGVKLIPQINLLGHQSWSKNTAGLLRAHPEFDETPGKYQDNQGIYCRSYCPLHPGVHEVVFDLIDEIVEVCEADSFHAGMDEVFLLGEDDCQRCKGKNRGELFAGEVRALRDHLAKSNRTLWLWGDRFLNAETTGLGKWEASANGTQESIRLAPKDIVICDWHYEQAAPTAALFATEGFRVVSSPWRKTNVALGQYELMRSVRRNAGEPIGPRMLGMLHTSWVGAAAFARAYFGEGPVTPQVTEAVNTFRELFREIRENEPPPAATR